mmetsp:Transcript_929/g.2406  ORF Transcript_929/g.2406 Transcript_929/m.2406 type:complete len:262 (+) Transcript_929:880-1665(+)
MWRALANPSSSPRSPGRTFPSSSPWSVYWPPLWMSRTSVTTICSAMNLTRSSQRLSLKARPRSIRRARGRRHSHRHHGSTRRPPAVSATLIRLRCQVRLTAASTTSRTRRLHTWTAAAALGARGEAGGHVPRSRWHTRRIISSRVRCTIFRHHRANCRSRRLSSITANLRCHSHFPISHTSRTRIRGHRNKLEGGRGRRRSEMLATATPRRKKVFSVLHRKTLCLALRLAHALRLVSESVRRARLCATETQSTAAACRSTG